MPAFSLFAILGVDGLRLRLRNRCGLGLNRNIPFLDGHERDNFIEFQSIHGVF
jgi:hypothetical protein